MRRHPDPETAPRVAADECFLAGLRGERLEDVDTYRANDCARMIHNGPNWCVSIATDSRHEHGITVFAWRDARG